MIHSNLCGDYKVLGAGPAPQILYMNVDYLYQFATQKLHIHSMSVFWLVNLVYNLFVGLQTRTRTFL